MEAFHTSPNSQLLTPTVQAKKYGLYFCLWLVKLLLYFIQFRPKFSKSPGVLLPWFTGRGTIYESSCLLIIKILQLVIFSPNFSDPCTIPSYKSYFSLRPVPSSHGFTKNFLGKIRSIGSIYERLLRSVEPSTAIVMARTMHILYFPPFFDFSTYGYYRYLGSLFLAFFW